VEDGDGVILGQRVLPLEKIGVYVPGGTAAYPSTVLMNVIPAQVAGVKEIHLASPPNKNGKVNQAVLAAASMLGVENVYRVGGAQAIAALAYGTKTIPRVDKIVGPGNIYVATAKRMVFGQVGIDSVAGPSEIAILADATAKADWLAADLLSQAEHDELASAVLITPDAKLAKRTQRAIAIYTKRLPRRAILEKSLRNFSAIFLVRNMDEGIDLVNQIAPEHLEIVAEDAWALMTQITNAGAIFLGHHTPEPVGDYFAGPSHVLPTGGTARFSSPLNVDDFLKKTSVISYTEKRLKKVGKQIAHFAKTEGLDAHALSVEVRLKKW
jgi:histidinol dehydrogenase